MSEIINPSKEKFSDLHKALTQNPDLHRAIQRQVYLIDEADRKGDVEARKTALLNLLRLCDYNLSMLVPYFFPKFIGNKPMSLAARPHSYAMMTTGANLTLTIQASRQVGKCLAGNTKLHCKVDGNEQVMTIEELFEDAKKQDAS